MKINQILTSLLVIAVLFPMSCSDSNDSPAPDPDPSVIDTVGDVAVWLTTRNQLNLLKRQNSVDYSSDIGDFTVRMDTTKLYQEMDGFGAALTGSSAYLLKSMDAASRASTLKALFDPKTGIGINYLRITIGSSDFSLGNYTYCDEADITKFAIPEIDKRDLIPVLKEIIAIAPDIKIMASPWSAPAWMKGNNHLYGGRLKGETVYNDFAEYFVRYVKAFAAEGITIDALTIQNEPRYETTGYPTMYMEWDEQNTIIKNYLGPKFKENSIATKIIIWDHNFDGFDYPKNILNDPITKSYVAGSAFHGYGGNAGQIANVTSAHPDKDIYFTEISGGGWNTDDAIGNMLYYMKDFLMASVNLGSKNFLMWNLALNSQNGPVTTTNGGCQNCRGVITIPDSKSFKANEEYYLLGHFAKFIRQGAHRTDYTTSGTVPLGITVSSFMNADKSKVMVVMNRTGDLQKFTVRCGTRKFTYSIQNDAVVSFVFK
ncbi:MAG TPA: glycoside hydrolase family 30 beta sandwich domain-containing protein [Bacteroidales bacterium]|nr:glycoside hydrolase family 30 beta sandwich domain-containing protein [Bacteroidales bacterium]